MFGGKKELERELELKNQEISLLNKRVDELNGRVMLYQNKEMALVGAMTEAQASARKTVEEAEKRRGEILDDAEACKQRIQNEIREMIEKANKKADNIINDARRLSNDTVNKAKADAEKLTQCAQNFSDNYMRDMGELRSILKRTAEEAAARAEEYRELAENVNVKDYEARAGEYSVLSLSSDEKVTSSAEFPEQYENPASLMKSIYTIQKRILPVEGDEHDDAQDIKHVEADFSKKENNTVQAVEAPKVTAEIKPVQTDESIAGKKENGNANEERVWTVDEIIGEEDENKEEFGIDDELDAIIDDVLRGS